MHHRAICWETRVCAPNLVSVTTMKPCYSLIHQHNHYHHNPSSMRSSCLSWYPGANWVKRTLGAIRGYSLCIGFPNTQSKRSSGWYLALSMTFERCYFHKGWMLMFFPESTWTTVFSFRHLDVDEIGFQLCENLISWENVWCPRNIGPYHIAQNDEVTERYVILCPLETDFSST